MVTALPFPQAYAWDQVANVSNMNLINASAQAWTQSNILTEYLTFPSIILIVAVMIWLKWENLYGVIIVTLVMTGFIQYYNYIDPVIAYGFYILCVISLAIKLYVDGWNK